MTLHHWQQLARPNLGGILVPRPGVLTKDFRQLDIDLEEVYSLNDLEEDDVDASSFQLLPTSTPTKAKERPGGERGARGRKGRGPWDAPVLPRLSLAPPPRSSLLCWWPVPATRPSPWGCSICSCTRAVLLQPPRWGEPLRSRWHAHAAARACGRDRSERNVSSCSHLCSQPPPLS